MSTGTSLRRFSRNFLIAVVAVATISMSTVAVAGAVGPTVAKSDKTTKSATKPRAKIKWDKQDAAKLAHNPAVHAAVRRLEIRKAEAYACTNAHHWVKYQKGLKARYAKRLANLTKWRAEFGAAHNSRKVAGLSIDIGRVEARQARNVQANSVLRHDKHAQAVYARCAARKAGALKGKGRLHGAKAKAARARMRAAEVRAAEIKAALAKAKGAKSKSKSTTKPTTTEPTKPTKPTTTKPTKPVTPTTTPRTSTTTPSTSSTTSTTTAPSPTTSSTSTSSLPASS